MRRQSSSNRPRSVARHASRGGVSRRGRVLLVVLGLIVVLIGAIGGWWWLAAGRMPLAGSVSHDFGVVRIEGDDVLLAHEFVLTNRRSEPVTILAARASCGCAGVEYDAGTIEPGASVTLLGRLALEASGPRTASVSLVLDNGETQRLFMKAVGRKERSVQISPRQIQLAADGETQIIVQARILRDDAGEPIEPPTPELEVPDGVAAEWLGWALQSEGDPSEMRADGWRGRVALTPTGASIAYGATLIVVLPGASEDGGDIRATCRIAGVNDDSSGPMPGGLDASGIGGPSANGLREGG